MERTLGHRRTSVRRSQASKEAVMVWEVRELDSLICFGKLMEWGASHGRGTTLLLRVKERSQVDVLIITCLVGSAEFLSPDLDLLRQVSKERGSVLNERVRG